MPLTFTDANFQKEVLQSKSPVLVDFWAPWCGPCRMMAPVIDQLAEEFKGKAVIGKMNVDENPSTPPQYGIMSIPTLIIFKNGEPAEQLVGVQTKEKLAEKLRGTLK